MMGLAMRRFGRWMFNGLSVLSLVLCVATIGLWIDSRSKIDGFYFQHWEFNGDLSRSRDDEIFAGTTYPGQIHVGEIFVQGDIGDWNPSYHKQDGDHAVHLSFDRRPLKAKGPLQQRDQNQRNWINRLGFDFSGRILRGDLRPANLKGIGVSRNWGLIFPIWSLVVLFSIMPLLGMFRVRRYLRARRRMRAGQCRRCGYDLRATPDRCPECGMAVKISS